jgi:membrane protein
LVTGELAKLARVSSTASGFGAALGILLSLFAASSGVYALIQAVNVAYDERETRGTLTLRWLALRFAVGISLFVCVSVATIAVLPSLMAHLGLEQATRTTISVLRWPALALGVMLGLALLYRYAPNRTPPKLGWVLVGSIVATLLWLLASFGLSAYVANFANYGNTYGALGAAVVLLLWLYVSSYAIILGAEINAELEHQTAEDTTVGPRRPMGSRLAVAADTLGRPRRDTSVRETLREALHGLRAPRRDKRRPVA